MPLPLATFFQNRSYWDRFYSRCVLRCHPYLHCTWSEFPQNILYKDILVLPFDTGEKKGTQSLEKNGNCLSGNIINPNTTTFQLQCFRTIPKFGNFTTVGLVKGISFEMRKLIEGYTYNYYSKWYIHTLLSELTLKRYKLRLKNLTLKPAFFSSFTQFCECYCLPDESMHSQTVDSSFKAFGWEAKKKQHWTFLARPQTLPWPWEPTEQQKMSRLRQRWVSIVQPVANLKWSKALASYYARTKTG